MTLIEWINTDLFKDFNTSFGFTWHHRCVAILSSAYQWGAFIEAQMFLEDTKQGEGFSQLTHK
jgi:hypothetical protein